MKHVLDAIVSETYTETEVVSSENIETSQTDKDHIKLKFSNKGNWVFTKDGNPQSNISYIDGQKETIQTKRKNTFSK